MKAQINLINEIQNILYEQERIYRDFETFNKERNSSNDLIVYSNIRSLNASIIE